MTPRLLRAGARLVAATMFANLYMVPAAQAADLAKRKKREAERMVMFMEESGAMSSSWLDQRKAMETLRQRVKDSRLDLDKNGVEFYRGKAKVMVDLERQRLRRAMATLMADGHVERVTAELRRTGQPELVELANNIGLSAMDAGDKVQAMARMQDVTDNYLSMRMAGYEQAVTRLDTDQVRRVMLDTEAAASDYIDSGGDVKALNRGLFANNGPGANKDEEGKSKVVRWLIGAIAGIGLIIAIFFSFTTMTITPFLTFVATVSGLLSMLGKNSQFQSVFFGNPYGPTPGPFSPYNPWNPYWGGQAGMMPGAGFGG